MLFFSIFSFFSYKIREQEGQNRSCPVVVVGLVPVEGRGGRERE
jgi:hypothetical protein